jgi:hypothetical protein
MVADNRSGLGSPEHARWLADTAEVGWLTSFQQQPAAAVSGPVETTLGGDGGPVLVVRRDSAHRRTLTATGAATLILSEPALGGVTAEEAAKVMLMGRARPLPPPGETECAVATGGPSAQLFALEVTGVRYQSRAGAGLPPVILTAQQWRRLPPRRLPVALARLVDHLNAQHAEQLHALCPPERAARAARAVVISDVRPQRLELAVLTDAGVTNVTLGFTRPVGTPAELGAQLLRRLGRLGWLRCSRTSPRNSTSSDT